ncbi:unnamed protein product [Chilo suppressalis]|uniref:G-protein coupled receptors family 1 profile domain-containing protein n=1 Tax=Chilo suppressalis TaxID=168631 RepID=A0ABN8BD56_CHISP|nr:unnamed protein product [Chilo suppressalis]
MALEDNVIEEENSCQWDGILNKCSKGFDMSYYMDNIGILAVFYGLWISCTIVTSKLFSDQSYRNIVTYTLASGLRRSTPALIHIIPYSETIYMWDTFSFVTCDFFGFWETLFAVFEMESLTMVCIERYVLAKYKTNGWEVPKGHFYLYCSLCGLFAVCYAYPPLVGVGQYAKDFDCVHCTFDMILPSAGWQRAMVVLIFFMRSIKPCIMMILMLYWARNLEMKLKNNQAQRMMTKGVVAAVCIHLICMLPITAIRGGVILSQLIYGEVLVFGQRFISLAMFFHWSSPAYTMFGLTVYDSHLRQQLINFFTNRPENDRNSDDTTN